jgi:beta-lactamase regulating signal transducer with metallopeptidase domain
MPTSFTTLTTAILSPATLGLLGTTALKATLILAVALALTVVLRRSAAATRHLVWAAALAGIVVLPALNLLLPGWYVSLPGAESVRALGSRLLPASDPRLSFKVSTTPTPEAPVPATDGAQAPREASRSSGPAKPRSDASIANAPDQTGSFKADIRDVRLTDASPAASAAMLLLEIWLAGVALALLPLLVGRWQLSRLAHAAHDVESDALDDFAARLARSLGVTRVVRLVEGGPNASPMTWGTLRPVVLVPEGFEHWSEEHRRDVLLHELAHVARYDCLTQTVARVACALYWFNPLAWIAARQLRIERERSCDDRVLLAGARPSSYAEHLLTIARTLRAPGATPVAALAMARPSQLEGRLLALLDARRTRGAVTTRVASLSGAVAIVIAAGLAALQPWSARVAAAGEADRSNSLPSSIAERLAADTDSVARGPGQGGGSSAGRSTVNGVATAATAGTGVGAGAGTGTGTSASYGSGAFGTLSAAMDTLRQHLDSTGRALGSARSALPASQFTLAGCDVPPKSGSSSQVWDDDDRIRVSVKRGPCQLLIEAQGKVTYNDEFTDVVGLARDGWFEISDKGAPVEHKLRIENDNGTLTRTWTVDRQRREYDDAARKWLAETLVELDRYTQFSNGARMAAVYKKSGVKGVLDETATASSDYAKRQNLSRLFKIAKLDEAQLGRVLEMVRTDVKSDYERSEILRSLVEDGVITPALQDKYIAAAAGITSGYERGRSLDALTETGALTTQSQAAVFKAAANTSSDYDRAQLMKAVMKKYGLSLETAPAFLQTAKSIGSDYDLRTLLTEAVEQLPDNAPGTMIESMLSTAAANIESEYDLAEFLITVARSRPLDDAQRTRIERAAEGLKGEYEYGRVMSALHRRKSTNSL